MLVADVSAESGSLVGLVVTNLSRIYLTTPEPCSPLKVGQVYLCGFSKTTLALRERSRGDSSPAWKLATTCSANRSTMGDMWACVRTSRIVADGRDGIPSASPRMRKPRSMLQRAITPTASPAPIAALMPARLTLV